MALRRDGSDHPCPPASEARPRELPHPLGSGVDEALPGRPVSAASIRWRCVAGRRGLGSDGRGTRRDVEQVELVRRDPYRHTLVIASAAGDADMKVTPKPLPRFKRVDGCGCMECREALK